MLAVSIKALFVMTVVVGAMAPWVSGRTRRGEEVDGRVADGSADESWLTLLHPLDVLARRVVGGRSIPQGVAEVPYRLAPPLALASAMAGFAVIPFGGRYVLGEAEHSLVVADLDGGVLWLGVASAVSVFAGLLAGWATRRTEALEDALTVGKRWLAYALPTALSLVGLVMVFESLRLTDIVAGQDRSLAVVPALGLEAVLPGLTRLTLPAWGIFLQPLGFALFLPGALMIAKTAIGVGNEAGSEGRYRSAYAGYRLLLLDLADRVAILALSSALVCLFLGGGAVPWADQAFLVSQVARFYGEGVGTLACMALQVATFFIKVLLVARLLTLGAERLGLPADDRLQDFCWKLLLPVSVLNAFATAILLLAGGGRA